MSFVLPPALVTAAIGDGRAAWLDSLPAIVGRLAARWGLEVGSPFLPGGTTAWVAPASGIDAPDLVLKVAWRHDEARDEAEGLGTWGGVGAVRLHRVASFADTDALLLERAVPGSALSTHAEPEQDEVIAGLLPRLWIPPGLGHGFRPLQTMCDAWASEFERKAAAHPVVLDPGLARAGIELFRALPSSADREVLLCTDLHAGNVLSATREPWLLIDPKPYVGDPTYDALQHMLNCDGRLHADPDALVHRMARLLDLDPARLRLWLFARCITESLEWPGLAAVAARVPPA